MRKMATHYLAGHTVGALEPEAAIVETYIADEASIPIWGPVIAVAKGTGELWARAEPTSTAKDPTVIGIAVGPLRDAGNGYVSTAAGQAIQVLTFGKGKLRVDGNADAIAVGDALCSHGADGVGQLVAIDPAAAYTQAGVVNWFAYVMASFAMALEASTVDLDIIPVHVYGARGTPT